MIVPKLILSGSGSVVLRFIGEIGQKPNPEQRKCFLDMVMNRVAKEYSGVPATYYVERHLDTLDVLVLLSNIPS